MNHRIINYFSILLLFNSHSYKNIRDRFRYNKKPLKDSFERLNQTIKLQLMPVCRFTCIINLRLQFRNQLFFRLRIPLE